MPLTFLMFSALLLKHYLADFVMQPQWMLKAKGRLDAPGGYAHAAVHGVGSGIVLLACGVGIGITAIIMAAEFVVHFAIDYGKDRISARADVERNPRRYWQLHGLDQLAHQITYVVIAWFAMASLGMA
ncbi:DUF3307 domain-containing protein [Oricola indica]|jgi:hypothetical protein|uniref:DUF3307 domain-containing protein n=1 Tax=Oricola indica TaxID=2872591 RepID=UPI001CBE5F69|nr:DUF3307 domain-containing protein [Oricola indica]